jgi:hypothetical protein
MELAEQESRFKNWVTEVKDSLVEDLGETVKERVKKKICGKNKAVDFTPMMKEICEDYKIIMKKCVVLEEMRN